MSTHHDTASPLYSRTFPDLGTLALHPLVARRDAGLLHSWFTHPKAVFWMRQDATLQEVREEYEALDAGEEYQALLGLHDGVPAFLVERYDPALVELKGLYAAEPGDIGMHFLTAPSDTPAAGFTRAVIRMVMEYLFSDPAVRRVVVEPDVRNTAVHVLNETVGFVPSHVIRKPEKEALLSFCGRADFQAASGGVA
ncbi:GNAT family N-acetyltransferase [Streptomyces rubiginosohelvolus]|uniref:GNAT family N-acetyltransferase n=1 Tax=Streptomyces rubiginosohelvolus TaxID=67362 RepID=UPI00365997D3